MLASGAFNLGQSERTPEAIHGHWVRRQKWYLEPGSKSGGKMMEASLKTSGRWIRRTSPQMMRKPSGERLGRLNLIIWTKILKGVTVVVLDIFSAISRGDLECFHSLLMGIRLSPFHAEMCAAKCLID